MGGASSYLAILAICGFMSATWVATKASKMAGISSIVAEIGTGVVLGPQVLSLISKEYATCEHQTYANCKSTDAINKLLKEDKPLGKHLSKIAGLDFCHKEDYAHHAEEGEPTDLNHAAVLPATPVLQSNGELAECCQAMSLPCFACVAGMTEEDYCEHYPKDGLCPNGEGQVRRLSGGGGDHKSYGECLYKSCEADTSHECGLTPDVFTLIGHAGVALMIFESGMHFDFEKAAIVGPRACVVAVFGTILPFITGTILTVIYGYPWVPDGVAVGTALAPTSVGIALRLLGEAGALQEGFGQAIITAAFVDDILSLILFNVLFSLRGDFDVMTTVINPIIGVAFMGIAMVAAVRFWPVAIRDHLLPLIPQKSQGAKLSSNDEGVFLIMMVILIVYGTITHFLGTHLWGCFIAGMSFACLDTEDQRGHTHHLWVRQTKRYTSWMIRIFFSCTVAFSIPIQQLISFEAFWKGSIMGIGPCILSKVFCAPFMGKERFVIGWAMVGRAEFAYLIAQMAAAGGMIDEKTFSVCIWALLYATVFAPFIFRYVLNNYIKNADDPIVPPSKVDDLDDIAAENALYDDAHFTPQTKKLEEQSGTLFGKPAAKELDPEEGDDFSKLKEKAAAKAAAIEETEEEEEASATPSKQRKKLWWGRKPAQPVTESPNGFLCCLFFKRIGPSPV